MHTAHFAAALVLRSRVPKAPLGSLLVGVFLCDFVWVALGLAGIESAEKETWYSDASHSLLMTAIYATLFAASHWRHGKAVVMALWIAAMSHFALDLVHPEPLGLYPHSSFRLGWSFWNMGLVTYWWIETAVLVVLAIVGLRGVKLRTPPGHAAATCAVLGAVHGVRLVSFLV